MSDYLSSPIRQMMYQNMLANLSNGIISPLDKDIMAFTSLPDSVIDPYIKRETDPLQMMNLTNNALQIWVEESKKASYFTKHFVTLSRMIMNGVATMARGLVTLHMRGEDLDQAPLSIQELISISSCQFRKSYLGVLQTVKSHPEISARLLENQLSWNNTLLKLFKTKEKLAKPLSPAGIMGAKTNDQISGSGDQNISELPQTARFMPTVRCQTKKNRAESGKNYPAHARPLLFRQNRSPNSRLSMQRMNRPGPKIRKLPLKLKPNRPVKKTARKQTKHRIPQPLQTSNLSALNRCVRIQIPGSSPGPIIRRDLPGRLTGHPAAAAPYKAKKADTPSSR